jgi:hypothetical protein
MKRDLHVRFCERIGLKCPFLLDFAFQPGQAGKSFLAYFVFYRGVLRKSFTAVDKSFLIFNKPAFMQLFKVYKENIFAESNWQYATKSSFIFSSRFYDESQCTDFS